MDFLTFTLFGSIWIFWAITAILFILLFWTEGDNNPLLTFLSIIAYLVLIFFWSSLNLESILLSYNIIYYFLLGLMYSVFRTYIYGIRSREDFNRFSFKNENENEEEFLKRKVHYFKSNIKSKLKDKI
jgi:ABC-type multidrug transport system fused ATPase/permease subunit